jgi:hypothetical protein
MTPVRRVADAVSRLVVRWAAPGCREWAEGLEREVEFIENDWRALAWAIGSARVLLEPREAPLGSLEEVPGVAHRYVDSVRSGQRIWVILFQGPFYLLRYFFHAYGGLQHFGCALIVIGTVVGGINILIERRRLKEPWKDDVYDDIGACTLFYRSELERQQRKLWIIPFVGLCFFAGVPMSGADGWSDPFLRGMALFCGALMVPAYLRMRRLNVRRIERLDALLAERP